MAVYHHTCVDGGQAVAVMTLEKAAHLSKIRTTGGKLTARRRTGRENRIMYEESDKTANYTLVQETGD